MRKSFNINIKFAINSWNFWTTVNLYPGRSHSLLSRALNSAQKWVCCFLWLGFCFIVEWCSSYLSFSTATTHKGGFTASVRDCGVVGFLQSDRQKDGKFQICATNFSWKPHCHFFLANLCMNNLQSSCKKGKVLQHTNQNNRETLMTSQWNVG